MQRVICAILLVVGYVQAQSQVPRPPSSAAKAPRKVNSGDDLFPAHRHNGKLGLIRGVLTRVDPIYDQLVVHTFGDGDIRIAFDGQTRLLTENGDTRLENIPSGAVLSVDTVMDEGKLFASDVRIDTASSAELDGQILRYEPSRSELILRDPISPRNISVRITGNTRVVSRGKAGSAQSLSPGMLVRVRYTGEQGVANEVEILAARGDTFTFEGRIIAVDLRSRVVSISNNSDQSLRELAFGTLDSKSLSLLREGAQVSIQAEFDGDLYNVRAVSLVPQNH